MCGGVHTTEMSAMYGEKALGLLRELKRTQDTKLPSYNEDTVRQVLEEMNTLFEQNQKDYQDTQEVSQEGRPGFSSGIHLRHACLERNQRCLLSYVSNRLSRIRDYRWTVGSVLPPETKLNLCEQEMQWFNDYNRCLAKYMRSIGETGQDLTLHTQPPKNLYILVRALQDYGEFEMEDGLTVSLKKNSQHYLLRSQCEHLIKQGILEHVQ